MAKLATVIFLCLLSGYSIQSPAHATEWLAPSHLPAVRGYPVPVVAHPSQQLLLTSKDPLLAANKQRVHEFWRTVILGGQVTRAVDFMADDFIEHNPLLPTGREAFQRYVEAHSNPRNVPELIPELVTLVAEGPYVVMAFVSHYPEPGSRDKTYTSTRFEMFRIADGLIAEHWDSTPFRLRQSVPNYRADSARPVAGIAGVEQYDRLASEEAQLFLNKRLVFDLWRHVAEGGREELADVYVDPLYIQHDPNLVTGREAFRQYFAQQPDSEIKTYLQAPLVAMVAEGDLVVQVLQTARVRNGVTYQVPSFDMFRIAGERVIEHWDAASKGELPAAAPGGALGY